MNKIKIMPQNLANKIAAGEVIEKCSSIVKELVENSIDAGAKNIKVELIEGGINEIRVTDDGEGMNKEDAVLAFSRHATSKVMKEEDLYFIDTLGFRGEALSAIASVSEVTLKTSTGDIGTTVKIKGGKIELVENSDAYQGTVITITNIFYNTPARLKFLKSPATEATNSVQLIERLALSHPEIRFSLLNNNTVIINTSGSNNLLKTIHEIFGLSTSNKMIPIKASNDDYEIFGYIGKPDLLKSNSNQMITSVNGRVVRNNDLRKMINDSYYTYKPDIKYPVCMINILTDQTLVDVNIHPTKQEIKFSKIDQLSSLVIKTIKDALDHELLIPEISVQDNNEKGVVEVHEDQTIFSFKDEEKDQILMKEKSEFSDLEESKNYEKNYQIKKIELYPVGLVLGTYIIAQNDEGMYLIDQHAAAERINYEKYFNALKNKKINQIDLLIPITIELSSSEFLTIKEHLNVLTDIDFELSEFGINTFRVTAHPTWLKEGYEEESIKKILDLTMIMAQEFDIDKFNENVAITLACKLSIKANHNISIPEMENLLNQLVLTDNPYNCPHGRPTIIKFTKYELERMFKRVMN